MKKVKSILMWLLFILTILYPSGVLITAGFGYDFELISISAFAIIIAVLSVGLVVFNCVYKNTLENKALHILFAIISPLSLINAVFYIFECPNIWVIVSLLISSGCCFYLTIKYGKPLAFKINDVPTPIKIPPYIQAKNLSVVNGLNLSKKSIN